MAKKKWAQDVDLKEGALKKIGGLNASKIMASVNSGSVDYATAMRRVMFLANLGNVKAKKVADQMRQMHRGKGKGKPNAGSSESR